MEDDEILQELQSVSWIDYKDSKNKVHYNLTSYTFDLKKANKREAKKEKTNERVTVSGEQRANIKRKCIISKFSALKTGKKFNKREAKKRRNK